MYLMKKILLFSFTSELDKINGSKGKANKTINNFYKSFLKFHIFLKSLICIYLVIIAITNILFIILFFFKFKTNYCETIRKVIVKLPFLKNIQNFLIAHLLLHTEQ